MNVIGDLVRHRDLLWLLTVREIRVRYARATLGIAWALFMPLIMMAMFTVLNFSRLVEKDGKYGGFPYTVYAFIGLVGWMHFATSLTQATPSLLYARDMLKKSAFPREVIPLAKVLAATLDLLIGGAFLAVLMWHHDLGTSGSMLALPVILLVQIALTSGVVLLTSAGNMFFRDVNFLVQAGIPIAMFATAVVYEVKPDEDTAAWITSTLQANPMSSVLNSYRDCLLLGEWPWEQLTAGAIGAVASLLLGVTVFRMVSARFAEEV